MYIYVYLCIKLFIIDFSFSSSTPCTPLINLAAQLTRLKPGLPGVLRINYSALIRLSIYRILGSEFKREKNIFRMAEGGSGVTWSLNFVEPVIAFLTGLFFGYQIWAKNSPVDSDFEDEEVIQTRWVI